MSVEKNTTKQWPDPKDFGLPVVEIKPLHPVPSPILPEDEPSKEVPHLETAAVSVPDPEPEELEVPDLESSGVEEPVLEEKLDMVPNQIVQSIIAERTSEFAQPNPQEDSSPKPIVAKVSPAKKESKSWIGIAIVVGLLILAVIIWQMMAGNKNSEEPIVAQKESAPVNSSPEEPTPTVNDSKVDGTQATDNQFSLAESESSIDVPVQKPQTGTTIDRTVQGTLIRVESKAERPTYFIIVGSLPNERMALEEAPQYQNRVASVYLITPYDDTKNYRLAIGSFGNFTNANEELERIKADYTEALWILKY